MESDRITFGGLATGLDTSALLEAVLTFERRPLQLTQDRRDEVARQQSLFRDFNTKILALRDAARAIDNHTTGLSGPSLDEEFLAYKVSSSDESVLTATASGNASPGSFDVRVNQLATVARRISDAFSSETDIIANAGETLTISHGGTDDISITIGAGGASLVDIRGLINGDVNNGGRVRAEVLFDGTDYRLIISGAETGVANNVTVTTDISGVGANPFIDTSLGGDPSDASIEVLGITVTRGSNEMTDVLPGLTLELHGTNDPLDASDKVALDVGRDDEPVVEKVQAFVDAYNAVQDFVSDQNKYDEATGSGGLLSGDATLRGVQRLIQDAIGVQLSLAGNPFTSLGQIGVAFDASGRLSLDQETLTEGLDANPLAVRAVLGEVLAGDGTEEGIANSLGGRLKEMLEPAELAESGELVDGLLASRITGFDARLEGLDETIERLEERLALREELLVRRFAELETLVSSLQAQASFLGQAF